MAEKVKVDRISQLPDQILIHLLSHLNYNEAARTQALSKRWVYLWTHAKVMNFDSKELASGDARRFLFIAWVKRAIDTHQRPIIDEFTISFDPHVLDSRFYTIIISNWIDFAIKKCVKRLKIELQGGSLVHTFPNNVLHYKNPRGHPCIMSLTSLSLEFVNISGELVEFFLSNCPLLEELCVFSSSDLTNLKVAGSALQLKFLAIRLCKCLESTEISAPNLVTFIYSGCKTTPRILIKHAPKLVRFIYSGYNMTPTILINHAPLLARAAVQDYGGCLIHAFCSISSYFCQLKTLTMCMKVSEERIETGELKFPELTCLKKLTLRIQVYDEDCLLDWLTCLMEKVPVLHSFTLHSQWLGGDKRKLQEIPKCPHKCLKVVEIVGFSGRAVETEVAMFFVENAAVLDTLFFNLHMVDDSGNILGFRTKYEKEATKRARRIKKKLPMGAKLVIK